ncbi:SDR family NAD(P)-dependent oxidoreductase [Capillimicrobium parvum]|uniref:3-phenylpropionate-dihydrodiol/cinnamic acid-dihydrodiol dehydrogenase n=1 Tax=Capillimicrobium parvum TaxID=2884022 RepID=A0A9E6XRQ4_9ACTN|nr:SDR family NAD(P)-dependent oxidoreductase [Capillimicrobium parvum]UGS33663.1 3-phenylpropionate-dihydrodiol/cinnamic acid-dihydrodiol dehydrogenase [Capillimicrobium parvum]
MAENGNGGGAVWLLTGCSTGIGRALAETLRDEGQRVMATARTVDDVRAVADGADGRIAVHALELTDEASIGAAAAATLDAFGRIDYLVGCGSTGLVGSVEECSVDEMQHLFDVNVLGTHRLIHAVLPTMRAQRSGHIAILTSKGAFQGQPGVAGYCASKAAVNALLEGLAIEVAEFGIGVTIVAPGLVRTNFHAKASRSSEKRMPEYDASAGVTREYINSPYPPEAADAHSAARGILRGLTAPEPPLNLALGADAIDMIRTKMAAVEADLARFEQVSVEVRPVAG